MSADSRGARSRESAARSQPEADALAKANRTARLLAVAAVVLAATNAITAYKLLSRQEASATTDSPVAVAPAAKPVKIAPGKKPPPAIASVRPPVPVKDGPPAGTHDTSPAPRGPASGAAAAPGPTVRGGRTGALGDPAVRQGAVSCRKVAPSGDGYTFQTPGCTSFVEFPSSALPATLAQRRGDSAERFLVLREPGDTRLLVCTMQGA